MQFLRKWLVRHKKMQASPDVASERAARGATYLDDVDPDWYIRIDPELLSLADGGCCVLGQLHGTFLQGLSRAGLFNMSSAPRASLSPVDYGFMCSQTGDDASETREYGNLNRAWRFELRRRCARSKLVFELAEEPALIE